MASLNGFIQWLHSMASLNGFSHWLHSMASFNGFSQWLHSMTSLNGSSQFVSLNGSSQWFFWIAITLACVAPLRVHLWGSTYKANRHWWMAFVQLLENWRNWQKYRRYDRFEKNPTNTCIPRFTKYDNARIVYTKATHFYIFLCWRSTLRFSSILFVPFDCKFSNGFCIIVFLYYFSPLILCTSNIW